MNVSLSNSNGEKTEEWLTGSNLSNLNLKLIFNEPLRLFTSNSRENDEHSKSWKMLYSIKNIHGIIIKYKTKILEIKLCLIMVNYHWLRLAYNMYNITNRNSTGADNIQIYRPAISYTPTKIFVTKYLQKSKFVSWKTLKVYEQTNTKCKVGNILYQSNNMLAKTKRTR